MDITSIFLLLIVGTIAGFLNVMAGGGSTITLPILIFMGLDSASANGTNRLAILIQNIFAVIGFQKGKKNSLAESFKMAVFALPGGIIGALAAVNVSDPVFKRILAGVLIFVIFSMFLPKPSQNKPAGSNENIWLLYASMFGIGFYGGFIQAGVGFLLMAALFHITNLSLVKVNAHKVFIVLIYTIPAFAVFIAADKVDWALGFVLAAGNAAGGWISSQVQLKKGDKIIRFILIIVLIGMSIKLLLD